MSHTDANSEADGIRRRIKSARRLWDDGDKEDAAALIFIATAGVSRLRHPRPGLRDKEAYISFVRDQIAMITKGAMPKPIRFPRTTKLPGIKTTENVPLEEIFYCVWRCSMVHEARWPGEVYLTGTRQDSDYSTYIDLPPDGRVGLPDQWILGLADAVENAVEIALPDQLVFPVLCVFSGEVEDLGSNTYQLIPGKTSLPKLKIRNQEAFPLFLDVETLNAHIGVPHPVEMHVMQFHDLAALAQFIKAGAMDERYVFNPILGAVPPPTYSRESLFKVLELLQSASQEPASNGVKSSLLLAESSQ